jgi:WD40 repeat protein
MSPCKKIVAIAMAFITFSITFSPSAIGQGDDFNVKTLGMLWESEPLHNATLWSVEWSPDGSLISATFFDNTTAVVNSTTGEKLVEIGSHQEEWEGTRCDEIKVCEINPHLPARTSAWSPDGQYLAVGGDNTLVIIYETETWEIVKILFGHEGSVLTMAWSPDARYIASGSGTDKVAMNNIPENLIKIWDFEQGIAIQNLTGHRDGIMELRWSSDQSRLVSASDDKFIKLWNTTNWDNYLNLTGHTIGVLSLDWSPNETLLVSGSRDYKVRVWNTTTGEELGRWAAPNCVRSVDWHPYENIIAASGVQEAYLMIRNATTGSILKTLRDNDDAGGVIQSSAWSPDGKRLASGSNVESKIRVYEFGIGGGTETTGLPPWLPGTILFFVIFIFIIVVWVARIPDKIREYERR